VGILGSSPKIFCEICHTPGHFASHCPNRYAPRSQSVLPAYATFNPAAVNEQVWCPDSAATSHMMPDDGNLLSKTVYSGDALVKVGDDTVLPVVHVGNTSLASKHRPLTLKNVLHVPKLQHNLLSVRQFCRDNNCTVVFDASSVCVKDNTTGDILL